MNDKQKLFDILTKHKGNLIAWVRLQPDYTGSKNKIAIGQKMMTELVLEHEDPKLLKAYADIYRIQKKYDILNDKVRAR